MGLTVLAALSEDNVITNELVSLLSKLIESNNQEQLGPQRLAHFIAEYQQERMQNNVEPREVQFCGTRQQDAQEFLFFFVHFPEHELCDKSCVYAPASM